jgi:divalent metal cation (Fe/Co/Zn/Cd) transporter
MSLLLGEAGDPEIEASVRELAANTKHFERVLNVVTVQQGPGQVMVSIKVAFESGISIDDACHTINAYEERLRAARPDVRWVFVEPDIPFSRRAEGASS